MEVENTFHLTNVKACILSIKLSICSQIKFFHGFDFTIPSKAPFIVSSCEFNSFWSFNLLLFVAVGFMHIRFLSFAGSFPCLDEYPTQCCMLSSVTPWWGLLKKGLDCYTWDLREHWLQRWWRSDKWGFIAISFTLLSRLYFGIVFALLFTFNIFTHCLLGSAKYAHAWSGCHCILSCFCGVCFADCSFWLVHCFASFSVIWWTQDLP